MEVDWITERLKGRCVDPFMCSFHHWLEEVAIAQVINGLKCILSLMMLNFGLNLV